MIIEFDFYFLYLILYVVNYLKLSYLSKFAFRPVSPPSRKISGPLKGALKPVAGWSRRSFYLWSLTGAKITYLSFDQDFCIMKLP